MPHLIIDYSANIAQSVKDAAAIGHTTMHESGLFDPASIKTRSYETTDYLIGTKGREGSFLHARVYLLEGRTPEQKSTLADALLNAFTPLVPQGASLTIDVRELDKSVYRKRA